MIFPPFVQKTQRNFGGPRAGSQCQELFRICTNFLLFCGDFSDYNKFAPHVQIILDTRPRCGYNGAGNSVGFAHRFRTGAGDLLNLSYLHQTSKKDLTNVGFARILAQEPHRFCTSLLHWRPRAKNPEKSRFLAASQPAFLKG